MSTKTIVTLASIPIGIGIFFARGFATWKLWGWFAVTAGAPTLPMFHVMGLSIIVGLATARKPEVKPDLDTTEGLINFCTDCWGWQFALIVSALVFGAILKAMM